MKIGIITVHDSSNYGSILQAYGLRKALTQMGHEVVYIKTRDRDSVKKLFWGNKKNIVKYIKNYKFNMEKYKVFGKELDKMPEIMLSEVNDSNMDLVVIGSDELWNVNTKTFTNEYFYGINVKVKNKIAYAISSGIAGIKDYEKYPNLIKGMKEISTILVRDKKTHDNLKELINRDCEYACDPTFLIGVDEFITEYENPIQEEYLLVYSYKFSKQYIKYIKKYAKENNLKIVAPCMKKSWADYNINCSALEFSSLIRGAKNVVTTTFHGTIFSILNKKQFVSLQGMPKVLDVIKRVGLDDRIVYKEDSYEEFKNKLQNPIDFKVSDGNIMKMRKESLEKLDKIIKNIEL